MNDVLTVYSEHGHVPCAVVEYDGTIRSIIMAHPSESGLVTVGDCAKGAHIIAIPEKHIPVGKYTVDETWTYDFDGQMFVPPREMVGAIEW